MINKVKEDIESIEEKNFYDTVSERLDKLLHRYKEELELEFKKVEALSYKKLQKEAKKWKQF